MPLEALVKEIPELWEDQVILIWKNPRSGLLHLSLTRSHKTFCGLKVETLETTTEPYLNAQRHKHCIKCVEQLIVVTTGAEE